MQVPKFHTLIIYVRYAVGFVGSEKENIPLLNGVNGIFCLINAAATNNKGQFDQGMVVTAQVVFTGSSLRRKQPKGIHIVDFQFV